jgi:hypothetical protein
MRRESLQTAAYSQLEIAGLGAAKTCRLPCSNDYPESAVRCEHFLSKDVSLFTSALASEQRRSEFNVPEP